MKRTVRDPQQQRAKEKKQKIIQAAYELFSEVGYHGTNTAEIAKRAGVSTGIVYGYFNDKKDILTSALEIYIEKAFGPFFDALNELSANVKFCDFIPSVLDLAINSHKQHAKMHEALQSMNSDEQVNHQFLQMEEKITLQICQKFEQIGIPIEHCNEKVHLAMDIVQSFAHEFVFDNHDYINYVEMRKMVERILIDLFN